MLDEPKPEVAGSRLGESLANGFAARHDGVPDSADASARTSATIWPTVDVEMVFELTDQLQDLERVEAEIGHQFLVGCGFDRAATEALEDFDRVAFVAVVG